MHRQIAGHCEVIAVEGLVVGGTLGQYRRWRRRGTGRYRDGVGAYGQHAAREREHERQLEDKVRDLVAAYTPLVPERCSNMHLGE
eukprot:3372082-Rhodomonas_salina.1